MQGKHFSRGVMQSRTRNKKYVYVNSNLFVVRSQILLKIFVGNNPRFRFLSYKDKTAFL